MSDTLTKIIQFPGVEVAPPASQEHLDQLSQLFNTPLPEALVNLWRRSANIVMREIDAEIISPQAVFELMTDEKYDANMQKAMKRLGWIFLLDMYSSDYVVMSIFEPLAPRLVWVPHDDGPSLVYRELDGMLQDMLQVLQNRESSSDEDDEWDEEDELIDSAVLLYHSTQFGDYHLKNTVPRTADDLEVARKLLQAPHKSHEWNFASQLLNETCVEEWKQLLNTEHFIRRDVTARLKATNHPVTNTLLESSEQEMDAFAQAIGDAARNDGMKVGKYEKGFLNVGKSGCMLEFFFHRRHIPQAIPRALLWLKDQADGKNPNHRAGNFMSDEQLGT